MPVWDASKLKSDTFLIKSVGGAQKQGPTCATHRPVERCTFSIAPCPLYGPIEHVECDGEFVSIHPNL